MPQKHRLDLHLLTNGLASSREKAQQLIRAGKVRDVNGKLLDKPGLEVAGDLKLVVKEKPRFVSRGGEKLLEALNSFPLEVKGKICLDGGISTGGFTDCLLQHGAARVYGVDVGYGQTAWSLRNDERVFLSERTNLRTLSPEKLYGPKDPMPSLAVADLSFISLRLILPAIRRLLEKDNADALVLVKPQFEVGRQKVGKKGVVRDSSDHISAIRGVIDCGLKQKWFPQGLVASPITGPAGNHEYMLWLGVQHVDDFPNIESIVKRTLN